MASSEIKVNTQVVHEIVNEFSSIKMEINSTDCKILNNTKLNLSSEVELMTSSIATITNDMSKLTVEIVSNLQKIAHAFEEFDNKHKVKIESKYGKKY